ncbi:MAG: hypothetical protein RDV41_01500 [Planctomycetota bacterium]|nr:hypothetical protein [Planctomycetota bacterium]
MLRRIMLLVAVVFAVSAGLWTAGGRAEEAAAPTPPPADQPEYIVREYGCDVNVQGGLARYVATVQLSALKDGWVTIPLFPTELSLTEINVRDGDRAKVHLERAAKEFRLLIGKKDDYIVEMKFVRKVEGEGTVKSIRIPLVQTLKSSAKVTLPDKGVKVDLLSPLDYETGEAKEGTQVTIYGGLVREVMMSWSTVPIKRELRTIAFAEQKTLLSVGQGATRIESTIDFSVLQGKLSRFRIELGRDVNLLEVTGANIRAWDIVEADEKRILQVDTTQDIEKTYSLKLSAERVMATLPAVFELPRIDTLDVERERGTIALVTREGVKVEVAKLEGASQADVAELQKELARKEPIQLGFRYIRKPVSVSFNVSLMKPKVFAELFTWVRASRDSLRLNTSVEYQVREAGLFTLQLKLEEGLRLVDIVGKDINNWQVKDNVLFISLRSKAEGTYSLQVETEKLVDKAAETLALPIIELLDVDRERGHIAVSSFPGIKVETVATEGVSQINVKDLPQTTLGEGYQPELAFRYIKHPYKISVSLADIKSEVSGEVFAYYSIDEKQLEISFETQLEIKKAGIFQIKLAMPKNLRVVDVQGEGIDDYKRNEQDGTLLVVLRSKAENAYALRFKAQMSLEDLTKGLQLPVISLMDVKKETGYLAVRAEQSFKVKSETEKLKNISELDIKDLPQNLRAQSAEISLAYRYLTVPWEVHLGIERIKPRVHADVFHFVLVSEALIQVASTVRFECLYAGVSEFRLQFPPGASNIDITGADIKHKEKEEGKPGEPEVWKVSTHSKKLGFFDLFVTFQHELKGSQAQKGAISLGGFQVLDVARETGYLAITARADVELSDPKSESLTAIDPREIPTNFTQGITVPFLFTYRYLSQPYKFSVGVKKHDFAEVLVAVIEGCRIHTTVSKDGNAITDIVYRVRNSKTPYLTITLPAKAEIWHLIVGSRAETPFRSSANSNDILVPITAVEGAVAGTSGEQVFDVRLRFAMQVAELGAFGALKLQSPAVDLRIMRLGWTLALPPDYELANDTGNMEPTYGFDPQLEQLSFAPPAGLQERAGGSQPAVGRNDNAFVNTIQPGAARPVGAVPQGTTGATIMGGKNYTFQSLIPLNKPAEINARVMTSRASDVSKGVVGVIFAVAALLFLRFSKASDRLKLGVLLPAALVALAIQGVTRYAYLGQIEVAVWILSIVTILYALYSGGRWAVPAIARSWRDRGQGGEGGQSNCVLWASGGPDKPAAPGTPPTGPGNQPPAPGAPDSSVIPLDKYEKKE